MEEYIFIGKIVNTHGIKGELRIISDFTYKNKVFLENRRIYIGDAKEEEVIVTYRHHKMFEMITLKGYNNINQVLKYKNKKVYIKKNDIFLEDGEYLEEDLIDLSVVFNNEEVGRVMAITNTGNNHKILEVMTKSKKILIPFHEDFIKKIDVANKLLEVELIEGMI